MAEASSTGATVPPEDDEQEYESDPDEALLPSAMRRREASDDEEGVGASDGEDEINRAGRRIGRIASEEDSEGQGGAPGYEDDEDSEREDYVEEGAEEDYEELVGEEAGAVYGDPGDQNHVGSAGRAEISPEGHNFDGEKEDCRENAQGESEEKKENEPFAVPTAGAFYMHDDRFRNSRGGRHGRMKGGGGRRLWESKDEKQWVHDRFEEMSFQDSRHKERNPRGRFRGRGGIRNSDRTRGYTKGNKPQSYEERPQVYDDRSRAFTDDQSRSYDDGDHQNQASKSFRGRGNRRYEPLPKSNSEHPSTQTKQSGRSNDGGSANTMTRKTSGSSNVHAEQSHQQKHIFNSSLNSASPPFYPSGSSSNQDIPASSKRDPQAPNTNQNLSSFRDDSLRGKPIVQDRYSVDESGQSVSLKITRNLQRTQGRGFTPTQQTAPVSQLGQRASQTSSQSLQRASNQAQLTNLSEVGESDSPRGSVKSVSTVSGKSKVITQGSGRGSFMYGGAQVMGAGGPIGLAQGDPNFPGTPALLPVMQFGGQHPGVPTVGMALPGYVAQPQMGFGNSEMTWVPVLAGSAGGMGGSYAPYFALDGSYYACPPGQTSSGVSSSSSSSRDSAPPKTVHPLKNPQRLEISNDEFGQRQNKPRRYSEMNFGQ